MTSVEQISIFDILKIGIGPSSSHTLGPWRAAQRFLRELEENASLADVVGLKVHLYGSLAKTGKGHGTDKAIMLSLSGEEPETIDTQSISQKIDKIKTEKKINLSDKVSFTFDSKTDMIFHNQESLPYHPNGMKFEAALKDNRTYEGIYYSVGGGFVVKEGETLNFKQKVSLPYPCNQPQELLDYCSATGHCISTIVWENEKAWRKPEDIRAGLLRIWKEMKECAYRGCHASGVLPGGLQTTRRAPVMHEKLMKKRDYQNADEWLQSIMVITYDFHEIMKWISCFAIAVNEENAAFGRVVTAPTNGAAGVIPAVLLYHLCFCRKAVDKDQIINFLLICGEIGSYYKKGATISAAMGGCQAEIGVSSSMAAAALTECQGGSVAQSLMAAEIAMEHHLGMTCDPVGGLVQIPCIERNAMGAIKAVNACELALESDPKAAKVSLDNVIKTMWQTAQDMSEKYKETSEGGLAVNIPVNLPEC